MAYCDPSDYDDLIYLTYCTSPNFAAIVMKSRQIVYGFLEVFMMRTILDAFGATFPQICSR